MQWEWKQIKAQPLEYSSPGELEANPTISDNFLILLGSVSQQGD